MNTLLNKLLGMMLVATLCGCSASRAMKSNGMADTKEYVMQSGGESVLKVSAPAKSRGSAKDGFLRIGLRNHDFEIWLVSGVQTIDEASRRIGEVIREEFTNFRQTSMMPLKIDSGIATQMVGKGNEADDGDDGEAEVVVFKVGDRVFIACTHGEDLTPLAREELLTLVKTAKKP